TACRNSMIPAGLVYLVNPSWIARAAARLMTSGVSKSGSPAAKLMMSTPCRRSRRARSSIPIVIEGVIERALVEICIGLPPGPGGPEPPPASSIMVPATRLVFATKEAQSPSGWQRPAIPKAVAWTRERLACAKKGKYVSRGDRNLREIASPCAFESAWGGIHEKEGDRAFGRVDRVRGSRDIIRASD